MSLVIPERLARLKTLLDSQGVVDENEMSKDRARLFDFAGLVEHQYLILRGQLRTAFNDSELSSPPHRLSVSFMEDASKQNLKLTYPIPEELLKKLVFMKFSVHTLPDNLLSQPLYVEHILAQKSFSRLTNEEVTRHYNVLREYTESLVANGIPDASRVLQQIITSLEEAQPEA